MPTVPFVLASASPARLRTLRTAGLDPLVIVSDVDEPALLAQRGVSDPTTVCEVLAQAKADDVARRPEVPAGALVLGCDSVLELDGVAHGKPTDAADAVARWRAMRGRSGVLRTGHRLARDGEVADGRSDTVVHFADVTDAEIDAYVATGEPLHVAGAFTLEGLGAGFVTGVEGDPHGVVGVSVPLLRMLAAHLGIPWPDLWA
ncbi:Maf family protein [Spongisporangium articulatum]|uniref:Nucleoside triphosphate pyrophosphatase n=1 Tax=Spongisporangium articulatum TaxID=3362603 RepID=A0ABW8APK8_9ACTN